MNVHGRFVLAVLSACLVLSPAASARKTLDLDEGWRFLKSAAGEAQQEQKFDDAAWQQVSLPHTWNRIGGPQGIPFASDATSGPAWYRLHFKAPKGEKGARYFLQFDGVGTIADVWLNGKKLGRHEGAFARFRFDATAAVLPGVDNVLAVKGDNSLPKPGSSTEHVVPLSGDFFMHGGLYRKVSLVVTAPLHVDLMDFGGPGVYAHAATITDAKADVEVRTRIANDSGAATTVKLAVTIEDAAGRIVARALQPAPVKAKSVASAVTRLTIANPHLWNGTADPYQYKVVVTLFPPVGKPVDEVSQPLGLRTIAFDADNGFFLNGKHVFLRGVSLHQDDAGKGWAMTCADQKRDFDMVQEMGANAVRLAHYQHDQCSYDEADRRGLTVWAEVPVVNEVSFDGKPASAALAANARQQLTELIRQNYNHPSVVMWSVGNEIDLRAIQHDGPSKAAPLVRDLAALSKQEDPSRPSTLADCCEQSPRSDRDVLVGLTDLVGYNRYFGWYYGAFSDFGRMLDKAHAEHPKLPISVAEYGAGAAMSQHTDDPAGGQINSHGRPHPEEFQTYYHEDAWKQLSARSYLWGVYIWNMFDFATKGREEGDLVDINNKGLVTLDRSLRKDVFYFYKANWSSSPTLRLVGRRYTDRPYGVLDVKAYSNAASAALSVNGKAVGAVPCTGGICIWKSVHLDKGANELSASATAGGVALTDSLKWTYGGSPDTVRIKAGDIAGLTTASGVRFGSDMYFTGGTGKGINPPDTAPNARITVAAEDAGLYDSYREGTFSYRIPLPNGRYKVTLRFVDPSATAAGERVFSVNAGGKPVLKNVDVFRGAGGKFRPHLRTFETEVSGGVLSLDFLPIRGQALLSACEVAPR
jgi:beta-galactosidase